eukprot:12820047-Alexandrium_andersonii.AAC.1
MSGALPRSAGSASTPSTGRAASSFFAALARSGGSLSPGGSTRSRRPARRTATRSSYSAGA